MAHLVRTTGTQEMDGEQSGLVAQDHRLVRTCVVRGLAKSLEDCLVIRMQPLPSLDKNVCCYTTSINQTLPI